MGRPRTDFSLNRCRMLPAYSGAVGNHQNQKTIEPNVANLWSLICITGAYLRIVDGTMGSPIYK